MEARLLPSGYIGVRWAWRSAYYTAQWCNPWWQWLSMPVEAEHAQILDSLKGALRQHVDLREMALTDSHLATAALPIQTLARVRSMWRVVRLGLKWGMEWLWTPPWEWRW